MAPSVRVRLGKRAKTSQCDVCPKEIVEGTIHAAVSMSFGPSKNGRVKYKGSHMHVACLGVFLIQDYMKYMDRERKPKGRQDGSSPIPEEFREERKHLIRTRARLLRLVRDAVAEERIIFLRSRIMEIQAKLLNRGGSAKQSMMRRSDEAKADLEAKLNV